MSGRIILENVSENKQLVKIGHLHILMAQTYKKDGNMGEKQKKSLCNRLWIMDRNSLKEIKLF